MIRTFPALTLPMPSLSNILPVGDPFLRPSEGLRPPPYLRDVPDKILETICTLRGFDAGVLYLVDRIQREYVYLKSFGMSCGKPGERPPKFPIGGGSLIDVVCENNSGILHEKDSRANEHTYPDLDELQASGRVIALPLEWSGEVIAVLLLWSYAGKAPQSIDLARLTPFAALAASALGATIFASQRFAALDTLQGLLSSTQMHVSVENAINAIITGIRDFGFDRVRAFLFESRLQSFVPFASVGMNNHDFFLSECSIPLDRNRYAEHTYRSALYDASARVYNPEMFGEDPHGSVLEKPKGMEWAVAPLVILGKVFGQIVADNKDSGRQINENHLAFLNAAGALAAAVIANTTTVGLLSLPKLAVLNDRIHESDPEPIVIKRLLVYLTCGESLAFSRALFFRYDSRRNVFIYDCGIGSITQDRFEHVSTAAKSLSIEQILDRVDKINDHELLNAASDICLSAATSEARALLAQQSAIEFGGDECTRGNSWLGILAKRINASDLLLAPILMGSDTFGLFVVDRQWRGSLGQRDQLVLRVFAQVAAQILKRHALHRSLHLARQDALWRDISESAAHLLGPCVDTIETLLLTLRQLIGNGKDDATSIVFSRLDSELNMEKRLLQYFRSLANAQTLKPEDLVLRTLLLASCELPERRGVTCTINCPSDLTLYADPFWLERCFQELAANSLHFFDKAHRQIEVDVEVVTHSRKLPWQLDRRRRYVRIVWKDNGCGVIREDKSKIFELHFTTRGADGTGCGLSLVSQIIGKHRGMISEGGDPGEGAAFYVYLPLADETTDIC